MREEFSPQPATVAYIACDLADHETLTDYRKRVAPRRRRWWHVAPR